MFWMFMTALWVVMLLAPLALLVALLPAGRDCPRCGCDTFPIRSRMLHVVRRFLGQRWCAACGWEGIMRYNPRRHPVPALEVVPDDRDAADDDALWRSEKDGNPLF